MAKVALITGITGQDGSYLAELLLAKGYMVHGLVRRSSSFHTQRLEHLYQDPHESGVRLFLHYGDLADSGRLTNLFHDIQPEEVYHLGAQSHVRVSFDMPDYTGDITGLGTVRLLEAIRKSGVPCRLYQASSSEMFGDAAAPQNEQTPLRPCSPYAAAKAYAYWMVRHYRQAYGLFACNGIMFNHESPRRGETFLSRKITRAVANIVAGRQQQLFLGNLTACRDWGYAPEYVEGMWLMLQHNTPLDLVFGTGKAHSVEAFLEEAFGYVDLDWRKYVEIDPRYLRPTDIAHLQADPTSAQQQLGWQTEVAFEDLVRMMVDADLHAVGLPTACPSGNPITGERFAWLKRA